MNLQVQIVSQNVLNALFPTRVPNFYQKDCVITLHAFSDTMKARVLELSAKYPGGLLVTVTTDKPVTGHWYAPLPAGFQM